MRNLAAVQRRHDTDQAYVHSSEVDHSQTWADMSSHPTLNLPQDAPDFRQVSVTHFNDYMAQKIVVERAWQEYNEKLVECSRRRSTAPSSAALLLVRPFSTCLISAGSSSWLD